MNKFSELYLSLKMYREDVDALVNDFIDEDTRNKKTYQNSVYLDLHKKGVDKYKAKLDEARDLKVWRLNSILDEIQDNLKAWLVAPVNDRLLNTVSALYSFGVKLSDTEIEALRDSLSNSYWGQKLLQKIAKNSNIMLLGVRDADSYVRMIANIKSGAEILLNYYCGSKMQGLELLEKDTNVNLAAAACNPAILKDSSSLLQASLIWDGDGIPSPRKKALTAEELEIVNRMYEGCNGTDAKKARTKEIISGNPEMWGIIGLSPYGVFIEEERVKTGD